jgi:hypothetical protein
MQKYLAVLTAAVAGAAIVLLASSANALPAGTGLSIQRGLAEIDTVERVVRVCNRNVRTGQEVCWIDRSRPPTVCHVIRQRDGSRRIDCY